jgi:hypothetical protein
MLLQKEKSGEMGRSKTHPTQLTKIANLSIKVLIPLSFFW